MQLSSKPHQITFKVLACGTRFSAICKISESHAQYQEKAYPVSHARGSQCYTRLGEAGATYKTPGFEIGLERRMHGFSHATVPGMAVSVFGQSCTLVLDG